MFIENCPLPMMNPTEVMNITVVIVDGIEMSKKFHYYCLNNHGPYISEHPALEHRITCPLCNARVEKRELTVQVE